MVDFLLPQPILRHRKDIINGIIAIEIINLDDIYNDRWINTFKLHYCSSHTKPINKNGSELFTIHNITCYKTFYLKIPTRFSSYQFAYSLQVEAITLDIENNLLLEQRSDSIMYYIQIPSIKINRPLKINDIIDYFDNTAEILKFCNEDQIQIKNLSSSKVYLVNISLVKLEEIESKFLIDLVYTTECVYEILLSPSLSNRLHYTQDPLHQIYSSIYESLHMIAFANRYNIEEDRNTIKQLCHFISIHCFSYLHQQPCYYRIKCLFCDSYLKMFNLWQYHLKEIRKFIRFNKIGNNILTEICKIDHYVCSICNVRATQYNFLFRCNHYNFKNSNITVNNTHYFCISCIYTIVIQYNNLKSFLKPILHTILNETCIEEIITFCIGQVNMFNMFKNKNNLGNKRCIKLNDCIPKKKPRY